MSEQSIPAWKRAGLKQNKQAVKKDVASYDPLKEGLKRAHESGETPKPAKPAKKPKLPKAERPTPTHELDQLAYLRQYAEDKSNWKFSKQKQNWILKHMFTDINDEKYSQPLIEYLKGVQGSARSWVIDDAKEVIQKWNVFMKESLNEKEEESEKGDGKDGETAEKNGSPGKDEHEDETESEQQPAKQESKKESKKQPKKEPKKEPPKVPTEKMAKRAQTIVKELTGEYVNLELLDNISS